MWCLEISFKRERERDVKTKPLFIYQWLNGWPIHLLRALNLLLVSPIPPRGCLLFALKLTFFPGKAWETTERFWIVRKSQTILFTSLAPSLFLCCCFLLLFVCLGVVMVVFFHRFPHKSLSFMYILRKTMEMEILKFPRTYKNLYSIWFRFYFLMAQPFSRLPIFWRHGQVIICHLVSK